MNKNGLVFNVEDRPRFAQVLVFALQQLLAIMAATIAVPAIIGKGMSASAALFGAGVGTLVYLLFTRFIAENTLSTLAVATGKININLMSK